jgi:hypothetical protein
MTTPRVIKGGLYAHGGQVFAFLDTEQPYDIPGCAALLRRAQSCSNGRVGTITVRLIEDELFPTSQAFAVQSDKRGMNLALFRRTVEQLFPGCKLETKQVTNFSQENGRLFWALIARRLLRDL